MRFLHLGDLHLGKSLLEFDLIKDQEYILDEIIKVITEKNVDALLIAGDVYDKAIPSVAAVNLLDSFLRRLSDNNIKTFIISGNHDSEDRLNFGSSFFESHNIYIASVFEGTMKKYELEDDFGAINIYMLPYITGADVRFFYPDEEIKTYEDALRLVIKKTEIDKSQRNIIISHQFVMGSSGKDPDTAGSEGLSVKNVGTIDKIGSDIYDDFDYVALGHIHSPQSVGRKEVRYAGSPLKYSLSEERNEKSAPLIDIGEKGNVEIELLPLNPMRNLRHIKGPLKELLDEKNVQDTNDYIYATLTDDDVMSDPISILRSVYPNTLKVDFDNLHSRMIMSDDAVDKVDEEKSFDEMIADFYRIVYGVDISEAEMSVMKEVAKEAGVSYEAD